MKLYDIIVKEDFNNLSKKDIDGIKGLLQLEIPGGLDVRTYLYNTLNILLKYDEIISLFNDKIFAGRCSVKWFSIEQSEKRDVLEKMESQVFLFNKKLDTIDIKLDAPVIFSTIKLGYLKYMVRTIVPTGINVVSIIDLNKNLLEVRSNYRNVKTVINLFSNLLEINFTEVDILKNFDGRIETFKKSLDGGKFYDVNSKPILNIEITREISDLIVNTLKALDNYYINKDIDSLVNDMSLIQLDDSNLGESCFTQLLLAGLCKMNIGTDVELQDDLCNQSLYNLIKEHLEEESGYISFTFKDENHTIQVGRTTNSISFRTIATEEIINYIESKII